MHPSCRLIALCTAIAILLCSCATKGAHRQESRWSSPQACITAHIVGGAAVGALAGAVLAAATGKSVGQSAVAGTVAGGTLAFAYAWGKCFASYTKVSSVESRSYGTTRNRIGYRPSQGTVVKIVKYGIRPAAIRPGDKPEIRASYYVMVPSAKEVTVKETVALKIYNPATSAFEELGESSETIVVSPGERKATSEIPIPSNAEEGKFFFVFKVEVQGQKDEREMPLTITRDAAILAKARTAVEPGDSADFPADTGTVAQLGSKGVGAGRSYVIVTVKNANIRDNPRVNSKIVGSACQGEKFPLAKSLTVEGKKWHHIKLKNGTSAWIIGSTCKVTE